MIFSNSNIPRGFKWRSSTSYILTTIGIAMFADLFLYGLIVPTLPFILSSRIHLPYDEIQRCTSLLLASYAGASVLLSLPAGYLADKLPSRQLPFLVGLSALFLSTGLLWVGQNLHTLVVARVLQGTSGAVVWTIGLAMIVDTVGHRRLGVIVGSIFSVISVGELVAPVIGGVVYEHFGEGCVFALGFALLAVDFLLRFLIIEKKVAQRYGWEEILSTKATSDPGEESPLLSTSNSSMTTKFSETDLADWIIPHDLPAWLKKLPIVYPLYSSPRLLTAQILGFTHALILAIFDATIPLECIELFAFTPLFAGLLFIPLLLPNLLLGPVGGLIVDRYGTKWPATFGLFFMLLPLCLFGLINTVAPDQVGYHAEITKFIFILIGCGIGLAAIGTQSIVDASIVIEHYDEANPGWFPEGGPYAQLYAVNGMTFSLGLTVGPLLAGRIKEMWGFTVMNLILAGWCVLVGILCVLFLGGTPEVLRRLWKEKEKAPKDVASRSVTPDGGAD